MEWVVLIANLEGYFPETKLRWVDPLETVLVLANNLFFEHTKCLRPVKLYRKGTRCLRFVDETEKGYEIAHCVLRWRLLILLGY